MINNQQRKLGGPAALTDGRLKDNRVGSGNQSNYLVTNDGVQTMDLPRNMLGPRQPNQGSRKTPLLIPPLKYIVYNNPQAAYDFLINKGYNVDPNIPSTFQFAQAFVKDNGDPGVLEFVKAAHPDAEVILKAFGDKKESNFSGTDLNSTPTPPVSTAPTPAENATSKSDNKAEEWIKLNTKTIIIILAIVVFFLAIRSTKA